MQLIFISTIYQTTILNSIRNSCCFTKTQITYIHSIYSHVVQSLICVWLFVTPWTAAHQVSLSSLSPSLLKLMSIELVMPSNHLIFCHPLSFCPQSFPTSESFPMSRLFTSGVQSIGVLASVLLINIQGWFPLQSCIISKYNFVPFFFFNLFFNINLFILIGG